MSLYDKMYAENRALGVAQDVKDNEFKTARERDKLDTIAYNEYLKNGEILYNNGNPVSDDPRNEIKLDSNGKPYNTGAIIGGLKEASNFIVDNLAPDSLKSDLHSNIYKDGRIYDTSNKSDSGIFSKYSASKMKDFLENVEDDPNAKGTLYAERVFAGLNPDGSEKYYIKYGYSKDGLVERQASNKGLATEILWQKRFANAEQAENRINQLNFEANNNVYDVGNGKVSGFGSGYSEIAKNDILGMLNVNQTDEQLTANYNKSLEDANNYKFQRKDADKNNTFYEKYVKLGDYGDALQYGGVKLVNDLADTALTAVGALGNYVGLENDLKNNIFDKWSNNAAKITGYNEADFNAAIKESVGRFKGGDYFGAITGDFSTLAESIFSSAPDMALMYASGGASILSKSSKGKKYYSLIKKSEEALKNGNKNLADSFLSKANKIKDDIIKTGTNAEKEFTNLTGEISSIRDIASTIGKDYGFNAIVAKQTNDVVEQRIANGDKDITVGEVASIALSQYLASSLDKLALEEVLKAPKTIGVLRKAVSSITDKSKIASIGAKLLQKSIDVVKASGVEAGQEYLQTWTEVLGADVGVDGKTLIEALKDESNNDEVLGAMLAGGVSGGSVHGISSAVNIVTDKSLGAIDTVKQNRANSIDTAYVERPMDDTYKTIVSKEDFDSPEHTAEDKLYSIKEFLDNDSEHDIEEDIKKELPKKIVEVSIENAIDKKDPNIASQNLSSMLLNIKSSDVNNKENMISDLIRISKEHGVDVSNDILETDAIDDMFKAMYGASSNKKGSSIREPQTEDITNNPIDFSVNNEARSVKNRMYGKLDDSISLMRKKIGRYSKLGLDIAPLTNALKTLEKYNNTKKINGNIGSKDIRDVSNEISQIGFISDDGSLIAPSISAYDKFLPMLFDPSSSKNIGPIRSGFVSLKGFDSFIRSRYSHMSSIENNEDLLIQKLKELDELSDTISKTNSSIVSSESISDSNKASYSSKMIELQDIVNATRSRFFDKLVNRNISYNIARKANSDLDYIPTEEIDKAIQDIKSNSLDKNYIMSKFKEIANNGYISPSDASRLIDASNITYSSDSTFGGSKSNVQSDIKKDDVSKKINDFVIKFQASQKNKNVSKTISDNDFDKVMAGMLKAISNNRTDEVSLLSKAISARKLSVEQIKKLFAIVNANNNFSRKAKQLKEAKELELASLDAKSKIAMLKKFKNDLNKEFKDSNHFTVSDTKEFSSAIGIIYNELSKEIEDTYNEILSISSEIDYVKSNRLDKSKDAQKKSSSKKIRDKIGKAIKKFISRISILKDRLKKVKAKNRNDLRDKNSLDKIIFKILGESKRSHQRKVTENNYNEILSQINKTISLLNDKGNNNASEQIDSNINEKRTTNTESTKGNIESIGKYSKVNVTDGSKNIDNNITIINKDDIITKISEELVNSYPGKVDNIINNLLKIKDKDKANRMLEILNEFSKC
jgi:hypothetical protein